VTGKSTHRIKTVALVDGILVVRLELIKRNYLFAYTLNITSTGGNKCKWHKFTCNHKNVFLLFLSH